MGLFRKMASVSTLGAIDMRSDKERTAAYTKRSAREAKAQTQLMKADLAAQAQQQAEQRRLAAIAYQEAAKAARTPLPAQPVVLPILERLAKLNALCDEGTITATERDTRRAEILREV